MDDLRFPLLLGAAADLTRKFRSKEKQFLTGRDPVLAKILDSAEFIMKDVVPPLMLIRFWAGVHLFKSRTRLAELSLTLLGGAQPTGS